MNIIIREIILGSDSNNHLENQWVPTAFAHEQILEYKKHYVLGKENNIVYKISITLYIHVCTGILLYVRFLEYQVLAI